MAYMLLSIHFFLKFLFGNNAVEAEGWSLLHKQLIGWLIIIMIGHQLYLERVQKAQTSWWKYMTTDL